MPDSKRSDEIDLLQLLLKAIHTFRVYFWLILAFFVLGIVAGYVHFLIKRKVFENKMIVSSAILTSSYTNILFDNINRHLAEGDEALVAKELSTTLEVVKQINVLRIESLRKDDLEPQNERDRFLITVEVFSQTILPDLQKGILHHLENNDFVKVRIEQNRKTAREMLATVEKEIADVQAFKSSIVNGEFFKSTKGNVNFDPTSVNSKILELTQTKLNLENGLELSNSVYVISGFNEFQKQTKPRLGKSLVVGAFIGLFLIGLFIVFKSIRKLLSMAERAQL